MPQPQTPQEKINPDKYKVMAEWEYKGQYLALLHNPHTRIDPWLSAESFLGVRYLRFEAYDGQQQAKEGFIERFHDMIHPIIQAEREWNEKSKDIILFTAADCIPESDREDYTGKVLIIKPDHLSAEYRYPEHQLFLARHGNGCNPDGHGTSVFGTHLSDGEDGKMRRYSFYGAIDPAKLPEWAANVLSRGKSTAMERGESQSEQEDGEEDELEIGD